MFEGEEKGGGCDDVINMSSLPVSRSSHLLSFNPFPHFKCSELHPILAYEIAPHRCSFCNCEYASHD